MQCRVVGMLFDVVEALQDAERAPKDYGTGHMLYRSELSFLMEVSGRPNLNSIELSKRLNVTRGAITQLGNRLEGKGYIERYARPDNKKEKFYKLTALGQSVCVEHEKHHAQANARLREYLCSLSEAETDTIMEFLGRVSDSVPISIFDCAHKKTEPCAGEDTNDAGA